MWLVIFKYLKYYPSLLKGKIKIKEKRYKIKYPQKKKTKNSIENVMIVL